MIRSVGAALLVSAMVLFAACNRPAPPDPQTPDVRGPADAGGSTAVADDAAAPPKHDPPPALRAPQVHRESPAECSRGPFPPGNADANAQGCKSDKDCKEGKEGRCTHHPGGHELPHNACESSDCFTDADCTGPGMKVCHCGGGGYRSGKRSVCLPGNCRTDSDCKSGYCSPSQGIGPFGSCGGGFAGYYCRTAEDTCVENEDCKDPDKSCAYSAALGKWTCVANRQCPVG